MRFPSEKQFLLFESSNVNDKSSAHEKAVLRLKFDTPDKLKYGIPVFLCNLYRHKINAYGQLFCVPELGRYVIRSMPSSDGYRNIAEVFADGSVCGRHSLTIVDDTRWGFEPTTLGSYE